MSFLEALGDQISSQFSVGENTNNSLSVYEGGKKVRYGALGDFAAQFDQSAERKYLEEGFLRIDANNVDTKLFEILMQEPNGTVLVKKRMLSALAENYRPDFMDKDERLYYKAMKVLFANKCKQIAALEKLAKVQKISSAIGNLDNDLMSVIFTASDFLSSSTTDPATQSSNFESAGTSAISGFTDTINRVRRIYAFNKSTNYTNWWVDSTNLFRSQFGEGTGVIEITNFTNISTSVSTDFNSGGNLNLQITDPYESMVITEFDIEKAISDACNKFNYSPAVLLSGSETQQIINKLNNKLNSLRNKRNAGNISFKINPNTIVGRRLTAIIDKIGLAIPFEYDPFSGSALIGGLDGGDAGVSVPSSFLKDGEIAGYEGLDKNKEKFGGFNFDGEGRDSREGFDSELSLFQQLVQAIYNKMSLEQNSRNSFQQRNKDTNYARRKLRFNFLGKLLIQPMDSIHVYINSKTKTDNKLLGGLKNMFNGLNFFQTFSNTLKDAVDSFNSVFNPGALNIQAEKAIYVGKDFPNYLWATMKPQFVNEIEGTHVFAGIVNRANGSWSRGTFTVDIGAGDNSNYLSMGKVNFKPAADVWNGSIYDPLTPFKTRFDALDTNYKPDDLGLLDENENILSTGVIKSKFGSNAGQKLSPKNYIQDRSVDPITKESIDTFYAPDGMVYKWKEGIGVFVQYGATQDLNDPSKIGSPNIYQEPYAGQDIMNIISLSVTGIPYNFATYWKAVSGNSSKKDPITNQNSANAFNTSLQNDLIKRNALWGNFVPFKNLVIDEASYINTLNTLSELQKNNVQIESKLQEYRDLQNTKIVFDTFASINQGKALAQAGLTTAKASLIEEKVTKLNEEIDDLIRNAEKYRNYQFVQVGEDISLDFDAFLYKGSDEAKANDVNGRRMLRRQVNGLTKRMSYNVRANEDRNLFIVDDFYDKDYDIAGYNKALQSGLSLYNNQFLSPKQHISTVAELLNLEVFCDTQGHIRVRPPQYNRMPSSVFYKMMRQKHLNGIQVFPQFLEDLFTEQLESHLLCTA